MKKTLLIITAAFLFISAQAQDSTNFWCRKGNMMHFSDQGNFHYVGIGYQYTQFMGLPAGTANMYGNDLVIDGGAFSLSASSYKICHNVIFGGELGGLRAEVLNNDNIAARVSQGFLYANLGYLIYHKNTGMIYPYVGIGGALNGLSLKNKTASSWDYNDFEIRGGQKGNFSGSGVGINLGIGFKKSIRSSCDPGYAMQIGFDLGVRYMPYHSNWYYNGNDVKADQLGTGENIGYYARLTLGKGTIKK